MQAYPPSVVELPSLSVPATLGKVRALALDMVHCTTEGIPGHGGRWEVPRLTELLDPADEAGAAAADVLAGGAVAAGAGGVLDRGHALVHVCHLATEEVITMVKRTLSGMLVETELMVHVESSGVVRQVVSRSQVVVLHLASSTEGRAVLEV